MCRVLDRLRLEAEPVARNAQEAAEGLPADTTDGKIAPSVILGQQIVTVAAEV